MIALCKYTADIENSFIADHALHRDKMASVSGETDKYEVMEVIGPYSMSMHKLLANSTVGRGAFGIIRRVKRKADNRVSVHRRTPKHS